VPQERSARQHCLGGSPWLRAQLPAIQGMALFPIGLFGGSMGLRGVKRWRGREIPYWLEELLQLHAAETSRKG